MARKLRSERTRDSGFYRDSPGKHPLLPITVLQQETNTILRMTRRMKGLDFDVVLGKGEGLAVFDDGVCSGGLGAGVGFDGRAVGVVGELQRKESYSSWSEMEQDR
jgi:hypothetical protein